MIPRYAPTHGAADLVASAVRAVRGDPGEALRERLAELHGVRHVFLLRSARAGLYAILKAHGLAGSIALPAYDCIVVPEAIRFAGRSPAFVDVDPATLQMTPEALERVLSRGGVAVVFATHVLGIPCDVEALGRVARRHGALLVEDAAAALGARWRGRLVGTFGDAAVVSFQATKVISGEGGGALLTRDDALADRLRHVLRDPAAPLGGALLAAATARTLATRAWAYGATHLAYRTLAGERTFEVVRPSERMPAGLVAPCPRSASALVLGQLDRLEWNLGRRRAIAQAYRRELDGNAGLEAVQVPDCCAPAWIQLPVRTADKAAFYAHMRRRGVDVAWTYRYSCADSYGEDCPGARTAARTTIGLPTYPSLTDAQVTQVCEAARAFGTAGARRAAL